MYDDESNVSAPTAARRGIALDEMPSTWRGSSSNPQSLKTSRQSLTAVISLPLLSLSGTRLPGDPVEFTMDTVPADDFQPL